MSTGRWVTDGFENGAEILWIYGGVLVTLGLGKSFLPVSGEALEWSEYFLLGLLVPVILGAVALRRQLSVPPFLRWVPRVLAGAFAVLLLRLALERASISLALLFILQLTLGFLLLRREVTRQHPATIATLVIVSSFSWLAASKIAFWKPFQEIVTESPYSLAISVLSVAGACWVFCSDRPFKGRLIFQYALIAVLFAFASFKPTIEMDRTYAGPAELVRQGGWLLWDVPSLYGFLDILIIALAPFKTVWSSVYFLNSSFLFVSAWIVFYLYRKACSSSLALTATITAVTVFLMPGWVPLLRAVNGRPSVGAFRFIWVLAFMALGVRFWESPESAKRKTGKFFWTGSALWVISVLWSSECAAYSTVIWFSTLAALSFGRPGGPARSVRWFLSSVARCVGLLAVTLLPIVSYYRFFLHHLPDVRGYYEHAIAYERGFDSLPIDLKGAVWLLLLVFCGLVFAGVALLHVKNRSVFVPWIAALGAVWSTSSYFVGRSHDITLCDLTPILLTAMLVALRLLKSDKRLQAHALILRAICVPWVSVCCIVTLANSSGLRSYVRQAFLENRFSIGAIAPKPAGEILAEATRGLPLQPGDRVVIMDPLLQLVPDFWLPVAPYGLLGPLSPERATLYFRRFLERRPGPGWLIYPSLPSRSTTPSPEWVREVSLLRSAYTQHVLNADYVQRLSLQQNGFVADRFEPKGP